MEITNMFDLTNKVAIVTGGYSGIGRGIAEVLTEVGANVVICARRLECCQEASSEINAKFGVVSMPTRCDVTNTNEVGNLVETTVKEFGRVDILVNSAGVGGSEKPVIEMSDEDWAMTLNIDLRGAFLCSRATAKEMMRQRGGKIINISSVLSMIAVKNMAAYCAAKAGLVQLTKVMALELVRYNIQVNAICLGYFLTPLNEKLFSTEAGQKLIERSIPMCRLGAVDEVKGIALYLASSASSFTTGASIVVDGGQTLW